MSPDTIQLSVANPGIWHVEKVHQETADKVSQLCNENHNVRHTFYNEIGEIFQHNHTVHHQLTLFACGATPETVEKMYRINEYYMQPIPKADEETWKSYSDPKVFLAATGQQANYQNFMRFFESVIAETSSEDVINKFVFSGSQVADTVLCHLFHGFFHPLIHFGYGLEFNQPAIIAESLAQAVVHYDWYMTDIMMDSEKLSATATAADSLLSLVVEANGNKAILESRNFETWDKVKGGVLVGARKEALHILSQYKVKPTEEDIAYRAAELMNVAVYVIAATLHPRKVPRVDFILLHAPNAAILVCVAMKKTWLPLATRARLLEWATREVLLLFMGFGMGVSLSLDSIAELEPVEGGFEAAIARGVNHPDDGHAVKLIRAVAYSSEVSKPYEDNPSFPVKQSHFLKIERAIVESLNPVGGKVGADTGESWVRGVGFEEAWAAVPEKGQPQAWNTGEEGELSFPPGTKFGEWVQKPALIK